MRYFKNLLFYIGWFLVAQTVVYSASLSRLHYRSFALQAYRTIQPGGGKVSLYYALDALTPTFLMMILAVAFTVLWWYGQKHVVSYSDIWLEFVLFVVYAVALFGIYSVDIRRFLVDHFGFVLEGAYFYTSFSGLLLGWAVVSLLVRLHRKRKAQ